ncbi:unnamed protein product [Caenorhabditis angaria]|uniref:G-protein coupled receptors family 1 profile domain-containing protein n=1 Tax=Caenorhabditis angaria TaxID=860376 RepID=A0A9P1IZU2_9PELO|nr:unnamed protein product [Caenorhabditis angaria]
MNMSTDFVHAEFAMVTDLTSSAHMGDFQVDYGQTLFMCILYIVIGSISMLCSLTTITLYLSSRELRKKYIFYVVLDFCEFLDAVSYVLLGIGRGYGLIAGFIGTKITVHDCFYTKYWPHLLILGTELPSICTLFLSFERILAVTKPALYKRGCTQNFKYSLISMVPVFGILTIIAAGLSVSGEAGERVVGTQHCAIITSTGKYYATFHFIFIVASPIVSFVSTLTVWSTQRVWKNLAKSKYGSQDNHLGMILAMSGTSILLLASPAIVMLTIRWDIKDWGDIQVAITYAMPGCLSIVNTIIAFKFRKELRLQLLHLLGLGSKPHHQIEHSMFTRASSHFSSRSRGGLTNVQNI